MVTGSRTSLLASSASVKTGRPFMRVWVPSSLMIRISASMLRSSVSCMSSATTVCPALGISSQNSSREICGWYPVKNIISGPIRKTHRLSTMPTPPWAYAAEVSRLMASSHAAIPRMIMMIKTYQNCFPRWCFCSNGGNSPDINSKRLVPDQRSEFELSLVQQQSGSLEPQVQGCNPGGA